MDDGGRGVAAEEAGMGEGAGNRGKVGKGGKGAGGDFGRDKGEGRE